MKNFKKGDRIKFITNLFPGSRTLNGVFDELDDFIPEIAWVKIDGWEKITPVNVMRLSLMEDGQGHRLTKIFK